MEVAGVHVFGAVNDHEAARRRRDGPSQVLDWRQLESLASLPYGVPVAWRDVDLDTRVALDTLPDGAITWDADTVRRVWRPAVTPVAAAVTVTASSPWRPALNRVAVHAAAAPRVLVVQRLPSPAASLVERAARLGVGVVRAVPEAAVVVRAAPRRYVRPGPVQWELGEQLWAASAGAATPRRPIRRAPTHAAGRR